MEHQRADSIEAFVINLVRSRLVTNQEAHKLVREYQEVYLKSSKYPDTITTFCVFLVASETITSWQCEKLRSGKWKGYFLDDFIILDSLGPDAEFAYFLARNSVDGAVVSLAVTPPDRAKGPEVQYQVSRRFN